jgi:hypothetical protein
MTVPGREEVNRLNVSVSSGAGSGTISQIWSICRRLRIIPPAETDSYDVSITDGDGHIIFKREAQVGTLSEAIELSLGIAKTVTFANATANGTYAVKFDMH